jgi:hypothetical protein
MRLLHRRRIRIASRVAARIGCYLLAFAVLCALVHAGARYFYCEAIGLSPTDPCAQGAAHPARCHDTSVGRLADDCCRTITMPSMPEGARAVAPMVPSAGVVAILPATRAEADACSLSVHVAREGERWRVPPRSSLERRAQLMVFLT